MAMIWLKLSGMKTLIILAGLPGSGKTTLATRLSAQLGYAVLSRDTIKRAFFGAYDVGDVQNEYAFDTLLDALPLSLSLAPGVIVDGVPFAKIGQAERVEYVAHRNGAVPVVIWLDCEIETASYRVSLDHTGPPNRSAELVRRVATEFRDIPDSWVRIDALQTPSDIKARVFSILSNMEVISHRGSQEQ
jgi:predicted kinase